MSPSGVSRLLLGLASVFVPATSLAQQPSRPALSWRAPAGCPQAEAVRARIEAIAGSFTQRGTHLQADGEIVAADGKFRLRLVVRDGELAGERNIVSDSCEDLAGAAAVVLGLLLSAEGPLTESELRGGTTPPDTGERAPEASRESPPTPAPQPKQPRIEAAPLARVKRGSAPTWQALIRAPAVVVEVGLLPRPNLGLALGGGAGSGDWHLLLMAQLWLNQTVYGVERPAFGANVARQTAALQGSRWFHAGRLGLGPSASLALERISAQGLGPRVVASKASLVWLSMGAGVLGSFRLGKNAAVVAELAGRVETSRPVIAIDGLGNVHQLGRAAVALSVGAEWAL